MSTSGTADTTGDRPVGAWQRIWFAPARPLGVIVLRWLVFGTVIVDVWRSRSAIDEVPRQAAQLWEPVSLLAALHVPAPTSAVLAVAAMLAVAGCAASLAHLLPRATGLVGAGAYAFFVMAENSVGKISHGQQPAVIMALVVAVAAVPRISDPASWRFRWPVQLCRATLAGMLLAAAWSKLTAGGVDWVVTDHLRNMLVADAMLHRDPPLADLTVWISAEPWRWKAAAAGTLLGEASLVLALIVRWQPLRSLIVIAGVGTLVGISLLVGLVGFPIVGLALVMLDIERLDDCWHDRGARLRWMVLAAAAAITAAVTMYLQRPSSAVVLPVLAAAAVLVLLARRSTHAPAPAGASVLVYDADCGFCTAFAEWVSATGRARVRPWQGADLAVSGLTVAMVTQAAYRLSSTGAVEARGADAIGHALVDRGGWVRPIGEVILCPPVRSVARVVYRVVARHRHRLPGGTGACAVPVRHLP